MLISFGFLFLNEDGVASALVAVEALMGLILFTLNLKGSDEFKGKDGNECESEFT